MNTPSEELVSELRSDVIPEGVNPDDWRTWRRRYMDYMDKFGHIIYDMDFAKALPKDHPEPMLETCKMYLRGDGINPHERQGSLAKKRREATREIENRGGGLRLLAVRKALSWAQKQAEVREDGIADIGLGYPLLRGMLLELGDRFTRAGAVEKPDHIFWLTWKEVKAGADALQGGEPLENMVERIVERKALWEAEKRAAPPPMLPPSDKYMGIKVDAFMAADETGQSGSTIKGLGASPGKATAPARVMHGPEEFDEMQAGDVLVASITTPAWTPLFAMASAIVTDIGGPLSHGSIVAREYGIPAVLGTGVATRRIQDGQVITVDGDAGLVVLPQQVVQQMPGKSNKPND
jgi:pyruvate,water dikinase